MAAKETAPNKYCFLLNIANIMMTDMNANGIE